ncbi:MAG: metallophosphatase family protein [Desulfobacteraceae bacterium]|nr:metallophosphatase family protein [Desulfobacteraceae bacterium]
MKFAVISDIHGNAAAFREVLKDMEKTEVSGIYCLGDNIGYGPEPEEAVRLLRERDIPSVIGNHELAVKEPGFLNWFNPLARVSLEKTMGLLSGQTFDYIEGLPFCIVEHNCRFVHGFPPDSATEYLFEIVPERLRQALDQLEERICFVGHTHELMLVSQNGKGITKRPLKRETVLLDTNCRYIVNIGSVGQPRDGNNNAKYVIFDDQAFELEIRSVSYNVTETVNKIFRAGLPEQHAWRLV